MNTGNTNKATASPTTTEAITTNKTPANIIPITQKINPMIAKITSLINSNPANKTLTALESKSFLSLVSCGVNLGFGKWLICFIQPPWLQK